MSRREQPGRSSRAATRLLLAVVGTVGLSAAAFTALELLRPAAANAGPSLVCTWTDAGANQLMSVADNWSPSGCGGSSTSSGSATLTGAQLVFPTTIPTTSADAASPIDDVTSLSIDSIVFDNSYTVTTPTVIGSYTLSLSPTSTPAIGLDEVSGTSSILSTDQDLTIHLGAAQEWASASGQSLVLATTMSGPGYLVLGDHANSGSVTFEDPNDGFANDVFIEGADVVVDDGTALGIGSISADQGDLHLAPPTPSSTFALGSPITVGDKFTVFDDGGDTLSGILYLSPGTATFDDLSTTKPFTLSGESIDGTGSLLATESAGGTVVLSEAFTDTGSPCGVEVESGSAQLAVAPAFPPACEMDVASGATLDLDGHSELAGSASNPGLEGAGTVTNNSATPATLTDEGSDDSFSGVLEDGSDTLALGVDGGGSLDLSGSNAYSGGSTVFRGTLEASGATDNDPLGTGNVNVANGAALDLGADFTSGTLNNLLNLGAGTAGTASLLDSAGTGTAAWTAPIVFNGQIEMATTAGGNLLVASDLASVTAQLTVGDATHSGDVTLQPLALGVCSGYPFDETIVAAGTLVLECPGGASPDLVSVDASATLELALPASGESFGPEVALDGGTLDDATPGTTSMSSVALDATSTIAAQSGETFKFPGGLMATGGAPGLTIDAGGSTVDFDKATSYTGTTTVQAGTLELGTNSALDLQSNLVVDAGAVLDLAGFSQQSDSLTGAGTVTSSSPGGQLDMLGDAPDPFAGRLTGALALQENGTSTLDLDGNAANTYSGGTTVMAGTLEASGSATADPFGTGGVMVDNGATLELDAPFGSGTISNPLQLGDGFAGKALLLQGPDSLFAHWGGPVALDADPGVGGTTEMASSSTDDLQIDGVVSGTGPLTVGDPTDDNEVILDPQAAGSCTTNTYTGGTSVDGELTLYCPDAAGALAADSITAGSTSRIDLQFPTGPATVPNDLNLGFQIDDVSPGVDTFSGSVALSGDDFVDATGPGIDFSGPLTGTGTLSVSGVGAFTSVVSGTSTYDGTIDLAQSGTVLDVTGSLADATVDVGPGATLEGTGTVGSITSDQGTVMPGTPSGPALLSATGPADLGPAGSHYDVTITGVGAGSGYPFLNSASTVSLDDATLDVTDALAASPGTTYVIVLSSAAGTPVSGTFAGLPNGSHITTTGGRTLQVNYSADAVTLTDVTPTPVSAPPPIAGYQLAGADGAVFALGNARYEGSLPGLGIHVDDIVGLVGNAKDTGYFLVGADGGVFAFGSATYEGSLPGLGLHVDDIVGMRVTSDGKGYWLVGSDGGVFAFGDARYEGSLPADGVHVGDIVDMRYASGNGDGYWLVGSDGGIFAFGSAPYEGSLPGDGVRVSDIVALVDSPDDQGYVLAGADGGVFAFGDAAYGGSLPGDGVHVSDIVALGGDNTGLGYDLVGADGGVFTFGDLPYVGSLPGDGVQVHNVVAVHNTVAGF